MAGELFGKSRSRIVGQAGRTRAEPLDGRDEVGRLPVEVGVPQLLLVPGTALPRRVHPLIGVAPAAVAALDHMNETRPVDAVGVVVAGEQVPVFVEDQLLGIAQARSENLQVAAVQLATQDAAGPLVIDRPVRGLHGEAAVPAREVQATVGADAKTVQVVAEHGDVHAVARGQYTPFFGHAVRVGVREHPQVRDAGVVDVLVVLEEPRADPGGRIPEAVREHRGLVGSPVAVLVDDQPNAVVLDAVGREVVALSGTEHLDAVGDGACRQVFLEPVHVLAQVGHPVGVAERLRDEAAPVVGDVQAHRVGEHRFLGPQLDLEALGDLHGLDGCLTRAVRRADVRFVGLSLLGKGKSCEKEELGRDHE